MASHAICLALIVLGTRGFNLLNFLHQRRVARREHAENHGTAFEAYLMIYCCNIDVGMAKWLWRKEQHAR